ncbi:MAG: penicillin acylase family protein [Bryobacteraceae bacterium]|nr:penicillin acylase family protein [Bryobacteraceae bacterium]
MLLAFLLTAMVCAAEVPAEMARWQRQAQGIRIVRDDWGIAHVYGKTDADTVFGAMYAQAEDDFNRVETNYLNAMGRLAEAEGEAKIYQDLRMKLFIDPAELRQQYAASPLWLKKLMNAYADGLNYYLAKHPEVKPRVIQRFEPWMALSFTEGSIGGDIESINLRQLEDFYGGTRTARAELETLPAEPGGSNGVAIAPANTKGKHALLLINPHTSFYFRSELQMVSQEGLNAYGASTWGQFFIYQGFNDRVGWMHTTSGIDTIDEYLETIEKQGANYVYRYGGATRPVITNRITIPYRTATGQAAKTFTVYRTHHGPVIRGADGKWVTVRLMHEPVKALSQSYLRTKAKNYAEYVKTMELKTNSSNNTIYADADGNIAYFHGNFLPKRDPRFDWTKPVDGSNPATEWGDLHALGDLPSFKNPSNGWLYNANNWPWSAAGAQSPKKENYPAYIESGIENPRGLHALRVLDNVKDFTVDSLLAAAYDSYLPWFEKTIPALLKAYDASPRPALAAQIDLLRAWNLRWSVTSVPTSLAVFWGEELRRQNPANLRAVNLPLADYVATQAPPALLLDALESASKKLTADFGQWKTPWGDINRFQRVNGDIVQPFNDAAPSLPVGFTSATWGSLASFGARAYPGTRKWYGTSGNSFVAVVEFGKQVRARAISAGGESGLVNSKHFYDQAQRYSEGNLREVYFYPAQIRAHTEREYRPGIN